MLEEIFGKDANKKLLKTALTHPSFTKENNLDREQKKMGEDNNA